MGRSLRKTGILLLPAAAALLLAVSCTVLPSPGEEREAEEEASAQEREDTERTESEQTKEAAETLQREFDREDVLRSLVQLHQLIGSFDEFARYRQGAPSFESYLETVFLLEDGPYLPGRGAALNVYDDRGRLRHRITRIFLEETEKGRWWAIRQRQEERELYCEVRVGPFGLPREVRYRNPQSGAVVSRRTSADQYVQRRLQEAGELALRRELGQRRSRELGNKLPMYYAGLVEKRRETITTPAGDFRAALLQSTGGGQTISVWYSPDVPGNVLRIVKPGGSVLAEIAAVAGGSRRFPEAREETVTPPLPYD